MSPKTFITALQLCGKIKGDSKMDYKTELIHVGINNKVDIRRFYDRHGNFRWDKYITFLRNKKLIN